MRVFIYEFVTGGGMWSLGEVPAGSLLAEGRAMADALVEDFAAMGADVCSLLDARLPDRAVGRVHCVETAAQERTTFYHLAARADWTIVIAPETGGNLISRCEWVLEAGGRLLSPGPASVALTSDKQAAAEHLKEHGIPVPGGIQIEASAGTQHVDAAWFPAVVKPLDGCGSQGVHRIDALQQLTAVEMSFPARLEPFVPGIPASVSVLCGPGLNWPLPACEQNLSSDGRFAYLGGRTPLERHLNVRAQRLALAAVQTLPGPAGSVGVDLVLGDNPNGDNDYVIEINPRLTTSYVGLRKLCRDNLAAAMIAAAEGREPALSWHERVVEFSADGRVAWRDWKARTRTDQ